VSLDKVLDLCAARELSPSFSMQLQRFTTCFCIRRVQSWLYVQPTGFRRW